MTNTYINATTITQTTSPPSKQQIKNKTKKIPDEKVDTEEDRYSPTVDSWDPYAEGTSEDAGAYM